MDAMSPGIIVNQNNQNTFQLMMIIAKVAVF